MIHFRTENPKLSNKSAKPKSKPENSIRRKSDPHVERELAAAVETLNGDRDRLYARVTVLEQGLDSVTGALAKPAAATLPPIPAATSAAPVLTIAPVTPLEPEQIGPPRPAEAKAEPAAAPPKIAPVATAVPAPAVTPAIAPAKPSEPAPFGGG